MEDHLELAMQHVVSLEPDQLRILMAHAAGLHANVKGLWPTSDALRRIADRLDEQLDQTRMATIVRRVCVKHAIETAELTSGLRRKDVCIARFEAAYEIRQIMNGTGRPKFSLSQIARALGVRDHTTVLHAIRRHRQLNPLDMAA
jgi:chromosomal replication initiation ATPase DnaA